MRKSKKRVYRVTSKDLEMTRMLFLSLEKREYTGQLPRTVFTITQFCGKTITCEIFAKYEFLLILNDFSFADVIFIISVYHIRIKVFIDFIL
jgi:hypothetical protein